MHVFRHLAVIAVAGGGALTAAPLTARAQSLLDRPPNVSGDWVGNSGTLYFHFIHRFTATPTPQRKVSNIPTFLFAAALPARILAGFSYSTNSALRPNYPNEWEPFVRVAPFAQDDNAPFDLGAQVGWNQAAAGADGELSIARLTGPVRLIAGARALSNSLASSKTRIAIIGGGTVRLGRFVALAGDVASLSDKNPGEKVAWSAGIHLALPQTPHSLSLQATNTTVATLEGASVGTDKVRYGFEFTIPITLRRYFGARAHPDSGIAPAQPAAAPPAAVEAPAPAAVQPNAPADTSRRPAVAVDTTRPAAAPATPAPAQPAAARPAPTPAVTPATPAAPKKTLRRVTLRAFSFNPPRIDIEAGTTVEFRNNDQVWHSVTATDRSFDAGLIDPGKSWRHTFTKPGTYNFFCQPHPFMKGVIVVRRAEP
jgi:plastocyanin